MSLTSYHCLRGWNGKKHLHALFGYKISLSEGCDSKRDRGDNCLQSDSVPVRSDGQQPEKQNKAILNLIVFSRRT